MDKIHYDDIKRILDGWLPKLKIDNVEIVELYVQMGSKKFHDHIALHENGGQYGAQLLREYLDVHVRPAAWVEKQMARQMTVGKLIKQLQQYDPDTIVGNSGHFGELLEFNECFPGKAYIRNDDDWKGQERYYIPIIEISITDPGPDPC